MIDSKLNKFMWTANGVLLFCFLVIGVIFGIIYVTLVIIEGTGHSNYDRGLVVGKKFEAAKEIHVDIQHIMYERPRQIQNTDFYLAEVVVMDKKLPKEVKEAISKANDISFDMIGAVINIIIFNSDRTIVKKLLPNNAYIKLISYDEYNYSNKSDKREYQPYIIYKIAMKDDNGDSRINDKDHMNYYISDLNGSNLKQITPDSLDLDIHWLSNDFNEIYFDKIIEDHNKELEYVGYYETVRKTYYYNVKADKFGFFDSLENKLREVQQEYKTNKK